jgi:hypothetical protein
MRFRRLFGKTIFFKGLQKCFFTVRIAVCLLSVRLNPVAKTFPKRCQKCGEKRKHGQNSGENGKTFWF